MKDVSMYGAWFTVVALTVLLICLVRRRRALERREAVWVDSSIPTHHVIDTPVVPARDSGYRLTEFNELPSDDVYEPWPADEVPADIRALRKRLTRKRGGHAAMTSSLRRRARTFGPAA